ncbi:MAG: M1 family aminopeptidase [Bacteroidota bacterium]
MWYEIFKFELQYRKNRPATYIYFIILFLLAFGAMSSDVVQIGGGSGLVKENAPVTIATMMVILSAVMMMITSAITGVAVLRDFEHKTESLMFTNPITKGDYLFGRFLGALLIALLIFTGVPLGFMLGEFMPWRDADKLLPFNFWNYLQPYFFFVIPNVFFTGAIFFAVGSLSRKTIVIYTQWVLLFVFYQVGLILTRDVENRDLAALFDPFAVRTIDITTQYWTVSEQNTQVVPLESIPLYNRLIWVTVGIVTLIITYFGFSFNVVRNTFFKKKAQEVKRTKSNADIPIPTTGIYLNLAANIKQLFTQIKFYFSSVLKDIPFLGIVFCGIAILCINSIYMGRVFGTNTFPTTYLILEQIQGFNLFFLIIIVFYSGELIWKERDVKMNLIFDAMPVPDFVNLVSKFFGLIFTYIVIIIVLIFTGIAIQTIKGYYHYELGLYLSRTFSSTFPFLILFTLLAFFVQVMVNQKFVGHAVMISFFIITAVLETAGIEHGLLQFGSGSLGTYSDMNGYGHFPIAFSWFNIYWLGFSILLFVIAVIFSVRGSEAIMKTRWKIGKLRLSKPLLTLGIFCFLTFGLSGCYIYYNTNVLNEYNNSEAIEKSQADYEKNLKKFEYLTQPKIVDVNLQIDLHPKTRDYVAEGYFLLANKSDQAISDIHLQLNVDKQFNMEYLAFETGSTITKSFEDYKYYIHQLSSPLQPDDTVKMTFKQSFTTKGFVESGSNTNVVFNGTFFNSNHFPSLGYNNGFELVDDNDRKDYDLPPKQRLAERDDERELVNGILGDDGDQINFEVLISTDTGQIALAPGYLQKDWVEDNRHFFHYKMDKPMFNFYSILSADYEVMRDTWKPEHDSLGGLVNLEIYYHKGHEFNLDRMMNAMKLSFDYFSKNFSPYQYNQMRILEFPRYATFAQSFANTVPFSEGIGFMLEIDDEDDVDVAFYVTAHELAHQWWAHQVMAANVQGSQVIIESLSQYSALMVMKQVYSEEKIQQFLKEELQRYLSGRSTETKREMPLATVENQQYIHYGKGAVNFYALQDYIGEDSINVALSRFIKDWNIFDGQPIKGRFPTTIDLLGYIRKVTPDSLQYVVTDLFEKIVLYENKIDKAEYVEITKDKYQVQMTVASKKLVADSLGIETSIALNDWIDIGIYGEGSMEKDTLLYLKKHFIDTETQTFTIEVSDIPKKVGIDPIHKLIDRNPKDNIKTVTAKADL